MTFVVDANIVFSALLNVRSTFGEVLLNPGRLQFVAPFFLKEEIAIHWEKIRKFARNSEGDLAELRELFYESIDFIDVQVLPSDILAEAVRLTSLVDEKDAHYVAIALARHCAIWSGDKKLINGLAHSGFHQFVTTAMLVEAINVQDW